MYNNKLVCAVKTGGKILREEQKDGNAIVTLPFGSEYSLLLKNLSGKRALVRIEIDGKSIQNGGGGLVLDAGTEYEIERPVNKDRKFKFIEKTQEISDYRGDRVDDSLIRVTWQFEQAKVEYTYYQYTWPPKTRKKITRRRSPYNPWDSWEEIEEEIPWSGVYYSNSSSSSAGALSSSNDSTTVTGTSGEENTTLTSSCCDVASAGVASAAPARAFASGITVGGEKSSQQFIGASIGLLENEVHSMVIQLRGIAGERIVEQPVTVSTRTQCCSCGRSYRKNKFKFCPNDGTALED